MIALFNALGLDILVPGNHEFDFGVDIYGQRMDEAHFAILAANLRDAAGQSLPHHQDVLSFEQGGLKIALIGSAYDATPSASNSGSLTFARRSRQLPSKPRPHARQAPISSSPSCMPTRQPAPP